MSMWPWMLAAGLVALFLAFVLDGKARFEPKPTRELGDRWMLARSKFINNHVLVQLHFPNARSAWWILDTGSTHNLVGERYAKNLRPTAVGRIRDINKANFYFRALRFGSGLLVDETGRHGVEVPMEHVGALDLDTLSEAVTRTPYRREHLQGRLHKITANDVVGILGYPFFNKFVVSIDFPRQQVWIRQSTPTPAPPPGEPHNAPQALQTRLTRQKLMLVPLKVNQHLGHWSLDTGSNISIMAHNHPERDNAPSTTGSAHHAQLINRQISVAPKQFNVGFGEHGNLQKETIHVPEENFAEAVRGLDGNLGVNLLKRFRVTLDFPNKLLVLD